MSDESIVEEYSRLGVIEHEDTPNSPCFCLDATSNASYQLCSTYPALLAVPSLATPEMLRAVATYRSRGRLPVLTWRDPANAAGLLARCAQPKRGLGGKSDVDDEAFVAMINSCAGHDRRLVIFDCRSFAAAQANKIRGGGVESKRRYAVRTLEFASLKNVHYVRRVVLALRASAASSSARGSGAPPPPPAMTRTWLRLQSSLLRAATRVARLLQAQSTVLLHCSDGWDRTPQVAALAQLCLDPHYRTVHGLLLLIEKDWLGFGHRFRLRHRLGQPIFIQFLDAVWQLQQQQPSAFGFTAALLADIVAVHDGAPPSGCANVRPRAPFDKDCDAERASSARGSAPSPASQQQEQHWASFFLDDAARLARYTNAQYTPPPGLGLLHAETRPAQLGLWELVRTPPAGAPLPRGSQVAASFAMCCPRRSLDLQRIVEADEEAAVVEQSGSGGGAGGAAAGAQHAPDASAHAAEVELTRRA